MRIVVCVKQVLDPELGSQEFRLDPGTNRPEPGSAGMVLDSYAENALETAIQLRDSIPGATVTALTLGDKGAEDVLRRALAFTANGAARIWDPAWAELDGSGVAHVLARAVAALGGADLVLTGRQAGDVEEGVVGPIMAEELGWPCVTLASAIAPADNELQVTREAEDGYSVLRVPTPAVVTMTSSESNVPRMPKVRDTLMARSKPIRQLTAAEAGVDAFRLEPGFRLERAAVPDTDTTCELLTPPERPEQAGDLIGRLRELKIL